MRILVTGGAGYVGSFATRFLIAAGHDVVVLDNLCQGHRGTLPGEILVVGDIADTDLLARLLREHRIEAVMHFAAATNVAESVANPRYHYRNNTANTLGLLETMIENDVRRIVFSSTAATYGQSEEMPLREDAAKNPVCAYGYSKLAIEWMLQDFAAPYGLSSVSLRYFNASGASPDGSHGEDHRPETHLIPLAIEAVMGKRKELLLFGGDYDSPDGTCVRDYIHVDDLALAHELAIRACAERPAGSVSVYNVGTGSGHTNLEVLRAVERVAGRPVPYRVVDRRPGDPARLVASSDRLRSELGWKPRYEDVEQIVATAWAWHSKHPRGYGD